MDIQQNTSLLEQNYLRLPATAAWYCEAVSREDLREALSFAQSRKTEVMILGVGSNIVLTGDVNACVIKMASSGISVQEESVTVAAGENWHGLVKQLTAEGLYGLENLALIPGCAGAAPIQNIGAYGVELSDRLVSVTAVDARTQQQNTFSAQDCELGYRTSLFKKETNWIVTELQLALSRDNEAIAHYPGVLKWIAKSNLEVNPKSVFDAVVALRTQKLPNPDQTPNVGSFFKNPILDRERIEALKKQFPSLPAFDYSSTQQKLSAAWLIDQAGLKGESDGDMVVSEQHALVLINRGTATGQNVLGLVATIRARVNELFGVHLETEPRFYPVSSS